MPMTLLVIALSPLVISLTILIDSEKFGAHNPLISSGELRRAGAGLSGNGRPLPFSGVDVFRGRGAFEP